MTLAAYQSTAVDSAGNVLPFATVTVHRESDGAMVQLYSDKESVTTINNPTTADANGFFRFYVASDFYRIDMSSGSTIAEPLRDVQIGTDVLYIIGAIPEDVRDVLDTAPYVATRTALKALDTTKDTVAWLKEAGREGKFQWDASNLSAQVTADSGEDRFVAPASDTTGASGAWVRAGSVATGSYWEDDTPRARIHRLADRLMVGDAAANDGLPNGTGSWLYQQGAGASMSWIERNAVIAGVSSTGAIGVTGAARNVGASGAVIGIIGYAVNYGTDDQIAWGAYIEGLRGDGANGTAWGIEVDVTNLAASPAGTAPYDPYGAAGATHKGSTIGIGIMAGGDPAINPVVFDNDVAINIGSNGAKWLSGLVFGWNALYREGGVSTARAHAISLAPNYALDWYGDSTHQSIAFSVVSDITDNTSVKQELRASSGGLAVWNTVNGKRMFQADFVADAVNYPKLVPSITAARVSLQAAGDDTNITLSVTAKGTGSVYLTGGGGNALQAFAAPSAVNWMLVRGEPAGTSPAIVASGSDTDIDLAFTPKGAGAVVPSATDGAALGSSVKAWSDLFLAQGAVLNFDAGDVTVTHSANALAFAGASAGYSFDAKVSIIGSGTFFNALEMQSANADANAGPYFLFYRNSASPANSDLGGTMIWQYNNSTPAKFNAATIDTQMLDVTAASEDVSLRFTVSVAGAGNHTALSAHAGITIGAPTGGFMGVGTINLDNDLYKDGTKVVGARDTGWTAMTGTPDESTAYATGSVTLPQLAGRVMALQAALTTHGLIGA